MDAGRSMHVMAYRSKMGRLISGTRSFLYPVVTLKISWRGIGPWC
jgi:hypothetical protein